MIAGEYEYFTVVEQVKFNTEKTSVFKIHAATGTVLGTIKWYGAWRKYCFFPNENHTTIWDTKCLRLVCELIDKLMEARKK